VTDAETLRRIKSLVIPPAWTDVWICPDPAGHIQAVGTDAAARRQYRYHDAWREERDQRKYDHILESTIDRVLRDLGASTEFGQLATHGQAEAAVLRLLARASAKDP
jgi:DNA topoisomerase IB